MGGSVSFGFVNIKAASSDMGNAEKIHVYFFYQARGMQTTLQSTPSSYNILIVCDKIH